MRSITYTTGTSGTNCWGSGQSQGYEADVTALVSGDGTYALTGLGGTAGDNVNGASLVVLYNDAISTNNRGVVFYTGNDSTHDASHLGDPDGWQASLPGVNFSATGDVKAILHVADGQAASDGNVTFSTTDGSSRSSTSVFSARKTLRRGWSWCAYAVSASSCSGVKFSQSARAENWAMPTYTASAP